VFNTCSRYTPFETYENGLTEIEVTPNINEMNREACQSALPQYGYINEGVKRQWPVEQNSIYKLKCDIHPYLELTSNTALMDALGISLMHILSGHAHALCHSCNIVGHFQKHQ
jgi:hypothetical protein